MPRIITPIPDLTITIPGRLRYWVAEALFAEVKEVMSAEAMPLGRHRRIKPPRLISEDLRDLAAKVQP